MEQNIKLDFPKIRLRTFTYENHTVCFLILFSPLQALIDEYEDEINNTVTRLEDAVTLDGNVTILYINFLGSITMNGTVTVKEIIYDGKKGYVSRV